MSNDNFKTFNMLGKFADDTVGSLLSGWGIFATLFVFLSPLILLLAAIKWAFRNGYLP